MRDDHQANFDRWFADSKVVDAIGKPLLLYHGTNEKFDVFDATKAGMGNDRGMRGRGFYFSPSIKTAASYGAHVMQVHVCIRNPFDPNDFQSKKAMAQRLGIDDGVFEFLPGEEFRVYQPFSGLFTSALKDARYDGVIYLKKQEIIAFGPAQIKSVTENIGTYDPQIDGWHRLQISRERGEGTIEALVCRIGSERQDLVRFQSIDQRLESVEMNSNGIPKFLKNASHTLESIAFQEPLNALLCLENSRQIAKYMAKFSGNRSFSQEVAEDYFRGAAATVTRFAIVDLIEGQPDGNERNLAKEKRYIAMDAETSPPIVVEDGNVMDGNHRLRAAKARGDLYILGYDVHDETERPAPHKGPLNAKDEATKNEISTHSDLKKAADALDFLDSLTAKKKSILDLP